MSVASYPILKLKPRTIFIFLSSSFFSMFSNIFMSMQMRSFVYSSLGQRAISQLFLVQCSVVQDLWQLKYTRGIWKVRSMVFYLSNQFTNPIMFGIILKSYLSSLLYHKFYEDVMMQTRKILL